MDFAEIMTNITRISKTQNIFSPMLTTYKVVLTNVPPDISREDLEPLIKDILAADVSVSGEMVTLTYHTKEEAEKYAVDFFGKQILNNKQ